MVKRNIVFPVVLFALVTLISSVVFALDIRNDVVYGYNCVRTMAVNRRMGKVVALTFDDTPNVYTLKIIKILQSYRVRATFFLVGYQVKKHPDIAKRIVDAGYELGNHSFSHRWNGKQTVEDLLKDIGRAEKIIVDTTGHIPLYLRPPGGLLNEKIKKACGRSGYGIVLWTVDSQDWAIKENKEAIYHNVIDHVRPGSVILFHSLPQTVEALPQILETLQSKGYQILSVSSVFKN